MPPCSVYIPGACLTMKRKRNSIFMCLSNKYFYCVIFNRIHLILNNVLFQNSSIHKMYKICENRVKIRYISLIGSAIGCFFFTHPPVLQFVYSFIVKSSLCPFTTNFTVSFKRCNKMQLFCVIFKYCLHRACNHYVLYTCIEITTSNCLAFKIWL